MRLSLKLTTFCVLATSAALYRVFTISLYTDKTETEKQTETETEIEKETETERETEIETHAQNE